MFHNPPTRLSIPSLIADFGLFYSVVHMDTFDYTVTAL